MRDNVVSILPYLQNRKGSASRPSKDLKLGNGPKHYNEKEINQIINDLTKFVDAYNGASSVRK